MHNPPKTKNCNYQDPDGTYDVEKVLNKKVYKGVTYYKLKWVGYDEVSWERADNLSCNDLIVNYEQKIRKCNDEDDDEWEVEQIVDKRMRKGRTQYLVKWKGWPGGPTWEFAENCKCFNLIAAFENPKLKKLWNFRGSNISLWIDQKEMLRYMRKYLKEMNFQGVNLLDFLPDFPEDEKKLDLKEGINIGPLLYESHWFLVIILVNHICVTKKVLIGDSLNTLIGVNIKEHPVLKRLGAVYGNFPIKPIKFTQMDRSDVCAFYVLAAFERALFLLDSDAQFVTDGIYFDPSRAELIRSKMKPETDGQISVSLPIPEAFNHGPKCEFCGLLFETMKTVDNHIYSTHIAKGKSKRQPSPTFSNSNNSQSDLN